MCNPSVTPIIILWRTTQNISCYCDCSHASATQYIRFKSNANYNIALLTPAQWQVII